MIYHYCSIENFLKILQSKEIWLFNSLKMNDYLETNWINHLIDKYLFENKEIIGKEKLDSIVQHYNLNKGWSYLSCFSKDNDVLSQWRSYTNNGKGVAIGFDEDRFEIERKIPSAGATWKISTGIFECIYDENIQKDIIAKTLDIDIINKSDVATAGFLAINLCRYSFVFKNPKFSEEKEVRIIHAPSIMTNTSNENILMGNISEVNFISKGDDISSYFKLNLEQIFNSELIPQIVLGPKNVMEQKDLEFFLSKQGLKKTEILRSMASYR